MPWQLTADLVESATGGALKRGGRETVFSGVSIDSRSLLRGEIFFAIRGPNQDGHRYIPDALSRGAAGVVADGAYACPENFPAVLFRVDDTHRALKDLAVAVRRRWPGTLVAVTGSMGKTTTRAFVAQVLAGAFSVYQTPGNYNNLFGLPLALFGLRPHHDFGIFEMGMSAPGEIAEMCRIAAPSIGILTNVAPVHLEFFSSVEDIAKAKGELAEALPADGLLLYNADDPLVCGIAGRFPGRSLSFGLSGSAGIRASGVTISGPAETRFVLHCGGAAHPASVPLAGAHYVMDALPAVALGLEYKVPLERLIAGLNGLEQVSMRGRFLPFREGFAVIDDTYNSNPRALMQMIDVLAGVPAFERRILVVGEMLELGRDSGALHYECGAYAAGRRLDFVIGVRGAAREIVRGALDAGIPESGARFFPDSDTAGEFVRSLVREGDLLLVKGSRGVRTERIVQTLRTYFQILRS